MAAPTVAVSQVPPMSRRQLEAVERCASLAVSRGLRIVGRGRCRVPDFAGAPVWAVASASREGLCHLVWASGGRLLCSCEARRSRRVETCSHAQCVRLALLAERAALAAGSVPAVPLVVAEAGERSEAPLSRSEAGRVATAAMAVAEAAAESRAERGDSPAGPVCPSCGFACSARELAELGECLDCVAASSARAVATMRDEWPDHDAYDGVPNPTDPDPEPPSASGLVRCPLCGAEAEADELLSHGARCATCAADALARLQALRVSRRRAESPAKIAATEEERQVRYRREGRAHDARRIPGALPPLDKREFDPIVRSNAPIGIFK